MIAAANTTVAQLAATLLQPFTANGAGVFPKNVGNLFEFVRNVYVKLECVRTVISSIPMLNNFDGVSSLIYVCFSPVCHRINHRRNNDGHYLHLNQHQSARAWNDEKRCVVTMEN